MPNDQDTAGTDAAQEPTGSGSCTRCPCNRFIADPTEPNICINNGGYPNRCKHPKSSHR